MFPEAESIVYPRFNICLNVSYFHKYCANLFTYLWSEIYECMTE